MEIKSVERPTKEMIEGFRSIPTSTISDILDEMGIDGVVSGLKAVKEGFSLVGPAVTVKEVSGTLGAYTIDDFKISKVIDLAQPGDVLVFDNGGKEISTFGGLASTAAKLKGIEGVVIDGACRDADTIKELNFPLFSRHVTPRSGKLRLKMLEVNGVIQCAGIRVKPGDILLADQTGILVIPKERAEEVLRIAKKTEAGERNFAEGLKKGRTFGEMHKETGQL